MLDVTLQVIGMEIVPAEGHIQLVQIVGMALPVGNGQAMQIPAMLLRTPLGKDAALTHGQQLVDAANDLPDDKPASDIVVASSMAGVDQAADAVAKFRGR